MVVRCRRRIEEVFTRHAPDRLEMVDDLMKKHRVRTRSSGRRLSSRWGAGPTGGRRKWSFPCPDWWGALGSRCDRDGCEIQGREASLLSSVLRRYKRTDETESHDTSQPQAEEASEKIGTLLRIQGGGMRGRLSDLTL